MKNETLVGGQKKLDVAKPKGKITGADFKKLRSMKEGGDHEVAMAQSSLQAIIEAAQELMAKMGNEERNIPGWIQDHITNSENYIEQAAQGFHELHGDEDGNVSLMKMVKEIEQEQSANKGSVNKGIKGNIKTDLFQDLGIQGYDKNKFNTAVSKVKRGATLTRDEEKLFANTLIAMINTKDDMKITQIANNLKTVEAGK